VVERPPFIFCLIIRYNINKGVVYYTEGGQLLKKHPAVVFVLEWFLTCAGLSLSLLLYNWLDWVINHIVDRDIRGKYPLEHWLLVGMIIAGGFIITYLIFKVKSFRMQKRPTPGVPKFGYGGPNLPTVKDSRVPNQQTIPRPRDDRPSQQQPSKKDRQQGAAYASNPMNSPVINGPRGDQKMLPPGNKQQARRLDELFDDEYEDPRTLQAQRARGYQQQQQQPRWVDGDDQ